MEQLDRQRFIDDIRSLARMKIVFRHQGRSLETGMDCINAPAWAFENQGLSLPAELNQEFESYHERPDGERLLAIMRKWFLELPPQWEVAEPGDLVIFYARRNPQHLAVKVTDDLLVEAYRSEDRMI